jgi:curved DNA-binding protein CbpA
MGARPKTLQEYCQLLGVSPSSDPEEIKLAFVLRRHEARTGGGLGEAELKEAFEALTNPAKRESLGRRPAYVVGAASPSAHRSPVNGVALLGGLLAVLAAVLAIYVWPTYRHHFRDFSVRDVLIEERSGRPYGTVLEASRDHAFPNGVAGEAYRVKLEDGREIWLPASDVRYWCVKQ